MTFALFQSLSWNLRCLTTTLSLGQAACDIFSVRSALRRQNAGADTGGLGARAFVSNLSIHLITISGSIRLYALKTERYGKCRLTYRTVSLLKVQAPVDRHPKWMITPEQDRSPAVYYLQSLRSFPASKQYWVNTGPKSSTILAKYCVQQHANIGKFTYRLYWANVGRKYWSMQATLLDQCWL